MAQVKTQDEDEALDPLGFEACYRLHRDDVFRWSMRYVSGNESWAEDIAHEVFLQLLTTLRSGQELRVPGAWLYRATANAAISHQRRERSLLKRIRESLQSETQVESIDRAVAAGEQARIALGFIKCLPAKQRVALCMHVIDDLSQREIAEHLGHSEGYVSKLLHRASARLRAMNCEVSDVL